MAYSQKYCLVSFLEQVDIGAEFSMADWPIHITLADVFAIDQNGTEIESEIAKLLSNQPVVDTYANKEATLGTARVVLLEKTESLIDLHMNVIDLLEKNNAIFNSPEFIKEGFLPHSTIQKEARIHLGDNVRIDTVALVDMFPGENWKQRKVLNTFRLQSVSTDQSASV